MQLRPRFTIPLLKLATCALTLAATGVGAMNPTQELETWSRDAQGQPTVLVGSFGNLDANDPAGSAASLLQQVLASQFGGTGQERFTVSQVDESSRGNLHIRFRETIHQRDVINAQMIVHADPTGNVFAVTGRFGAATQSLAQQPGMQAQQALQVSLLEANIHGGETSGSPTLVYVLNPEDGLVRLAWRHFVKYSNEDDGGPEADYVFSDSYTGELVARHPTIHRAKVWQTHDAFNSDDEDLLPGLMICDGAPTCVTDDFDAQLTHNNTSTTYDYFDARFERDSLDDAGQTLTSTVHFGINFNNAFWSGSQMVYGDGDGVSRLPWGQALDIVAHEITHGITQNTNGLVYMDESGALSEAWSDIFAAAAEAWDDGGITANTWTIGEDISIGDPLRFMNDPELLGDRDFYPDRYTGNGDNGGVHTNSGIANLAFQLLVEGGTHPRGKTTHTVPAIGMWQAEQIFYDAQFFLPPNATFAEARNATLLAALHNDTLWTATRLAWAAVGIHGLNNFGYDALAGSWRVDKHPRMTADVNGDGKDDIVGFGGAGVYVGIVEDGSSAAAELWLNNFGYDFAAGGYRVDKHPRMMADVNGDGRADAVAFGGAGVYVGLSTGSSFLPATLWRNNFGFDATAGGWRVDKHPRMMADMNGDGKDDVVGFGGAGVYVALSNGSSFLPAALWLDNMGYDDDAGGWRIDKHPRMAADVNGDGKADIVGFGGAGVYVAPSTGSGLWPPWLWLDGQFGYDAAAGGYRVDKHPRMMADVDGDGRADIVAFGGAGVYVAKSSGSGFEGSSLWLNNFGYDVAAGGWRIDQHPRMMADVNGDGRADVVGYGGAGPYLATSTGGSFNPAYLRVNNLGLDATAGGWQVDKHPRMTGDINGDGKADIVAFGGRTVYLYLNH